VPSLVRHSNGERSAADRGACRSRRSDQPRRRSCARCFHREAVTFFRNQQPTWRVLSIASAIKDSLFITRNGALYLGAVDLSRRQAEEFRGDLLSSGARARALEPSPPRRRRSPASGGRICSIGDTRRDDHRAERDSSSPLFVRAQWQMVCVSSRASGSAFSDSVRSPISSAVRLGRLDLEVVLAHGRQPLILRTPVSPHDGGLVAQVLEREAVRALHYQMSYSRRGKTFRVLDRRAHGRRSWRSPRRVDEVVAVPNVILIKQNLVIREVRIGRVDGDLALLLEVADQAHIPRVLLDYRRAGRSSAWGQTFPRVRFLGAVYRRPTATRLEMRFPETLKRPNRLTLRKELPTAGRFGTEMRSIQLRFVAPSSRQLAQADSVPTAALDRRRNRPA